MTCLYDSCQKIGARYQCTFQPIRLCQSEQFLGFLIKLPKFFPCVALANRFTGLARNICCGLSALGGAI